MTSLTYDEINSEKCKQLLRERSSFEVVGLSGKMGSAVTSMEKAIESQGYKCRIYTKGRVAALGAAAIPVSPTVIGGWIAGIGIGIHNLATFNPDYEIAKHQIDNKLSVN
jgi:hypothetical protein